MVRSSVLALAASISLATLGLTTDAFARGGGGGHFGGGFGGGHFGGGRDFGGGMRDFHPEMGEPRMEDRHPAEERRPADDHHADDAPRHVEDHADHPCLLYTSPSP